METSEPLEPPNADNATQRINESLTVGGVDLPAIGSRRDGRRAQA
jgi:hypothetical protein